MASSRFVPLRNYIFDRLYHPTQGYFCKPNFQVGQLKTPINFKSLIGYDDYQRQLVEKYPPNAWLTPCEIFKPYYGMTIARYLKAAHEIYCGEGNLKQKLRIVEAGAGTGSAAESILYFFNNFHRQMLPNIQYTIVEISPTLCKRIQQKLSKSFPHLIKNKQIRIINQDISDYEQNENSFVLFFEVLDNMPHDKVLWNQEIKQYDRYITVDLNNNVESFCSIDQDLLIKQCLEIYNSLGESQVEVKQNFLDKVAGFFVKRMIKKTQSSSKDLFLPTYMLRLLKRMKRNVPNCHLVISDFDKLVSPVSGINAPIVSKKGFKSNQKVDYNSYLVQRGEADIFFPIDFTLLKKMHKTVLGKSAKIVKSYEFIGEFSQESWAKTKSNFNPIRQDFGNTSFLVTDISQLAK